MSRAGMRRAAYWVEFVLLVAGGICVGWFGWSQASQWFEESYGEYELREMARGRTPDIEGYLESLFRREDEVIVPERKDEPKEEARPLDRPKKGELIGQIEIPRIKVSAVVRQGVDKEVLRRSAGHVPYTALPGETGNVGIAAHRDSHFRNLRDVEVGDRIRLKTANAVYEYQVESLKVVKPENIEVLDPTEKASLTLVTCYPFNYVGSAPNRFIVRARQIDSAVDAQRRTPAKSRARS